MVLTFSNFDVDAKSWLKKLEWNEGNNVDFKALMVFKS